MSHEASEACEGSAFHFIVGYLSAIVFEFFYAAVEVGVGERQTEFASLRAVESDSGYCIATYHVVASDLVDQIFVGVDDIWFCP